MGEKTMKLYMSSMLVLLSIMLFSPSMPKQEATELKFQTIPDEAIRLRILANSDSDKDQQLKYMIRDEVNAEISDWVEHIDDIDEARHLIETNIHKVEQTVKRVLKEQNSDQSINIQYKSNITFPMKVYDHYVYPAGEYEAVLITLGEGKGANWWCVLFPPLCFLDFSEGATVAEATDDQEQLDEEEDVTIKFFLFEWLGWS